MESNLKRCPHVGEHFLFHVEVERQGRWRGVEFENLERLLSPDPLSLRPRGGGFPHLREIPRLVFNPEAGDPPRDLEGGFSGYWPMSERLRLAILSVDPLACAFVECDYRLVDGSPGPPLFPLRRGAGARGAG